MAFGSYQGALAAYAHAIEVAPTDRSGYQGKACALACLGQHAEADAVLKQANVLEL
jgi:Flp pilus assembly protein TadD